MTHFYYKCLQNVIGTAIIGYVPLLLSGMIIIGVGIFAIFMTLGQIKFASTIVNIAFLLVLGGLSVAFGIGDVSLLRDNLKS